VIAAAWRASIWTVLPAATSTALLFSDGVVRADAVFSSVDVVAHDALDAFFRKLKHVSPRRPPPLRAPRRPHRSLRG
jgi:hypothetical protein